MRLAQLGPNPGRTDATAQPHQRDLQSALRACLSQRLRRPSASTICVHHSQSVHAASTTHRPSTFPPAIACTHRAMFFPLPAVAGVCRAVAPLLSLPWTAAIVAAAAPSTLCTRYILCTCALPAPDARRSARLDLCIHAPSVLHPHFPLPHPHRRLPCSRGLLSPHELPALLSPAIVATACSCPSVSCVSVSCMSLGIGKRFPAALSVGAAARFRFLRPSAIFSCVCHFGYYITLGHLPHRLSWRYQELCWLLTELLHPTYTLLCYSPLPGPVYCFCIY